MGKYGVNRAVVRKTAIGYTVAGEGFGVTREKRKFRLRRTADKYADKLARKYDVPLVISTSHIR